MTRTPFRDAAVVLASALILAILFAVLDARQAPPEIDTAELTGWFKLEGRN